MKDENKSPAERLERALQDLKNRKKAAAVSAAKFDQELEKFDEVQKKLDALPYHERREVLDASGLKHRSRAPRPIITPRDISRYIPPSRPPEVLAMAAPTEQLAPAQNTATPAPVKTDSATKTRSNKSEKTLIFEAKVLELLGKFWNDRKPGTEPTKAELCGLVYAEIMRTDIRGERKTTQSMVTDAAKSWRFPLVLPKFVADSKFNDKRHPFKGDK